MRLNGCAAVAVRRAGSLKTNAMQKRLNTSKAAPG